MENFNFKNSVYQGNAGLGAAIAYYSSLNYIPSLPISDCTHYDLLVDDGESIKKVQCKTTGYKSDYGVYSVTLSTQGGNQSYHTKKLFDASLIDYLFILTSDGRWYNIPASEINSKHTLSLGKDRDDFLVNGVVVREYKENRAITERNSRRRERKPKEPRVRKSRTGRTKIEWPSHDVLTQMVYDSNYSEVGRQLGVSDNAVRKRLKTHAENRP